MVATPVWVAMVAASLKAARWEASLSLQVAALHLAPVSHQGLALLV